MRQRWALGILRILNVELQTQLGELPAGCLIVANHISWLDIYAINAAFPAAFISKAEVRQWPLIGWLAACNDTIFLQRGSRAHARQANTDIASKMAEGKRLVLFPEGTTTDGSQVLDFHAALLQPALAAERPIIPLSVRYEAPDGTRSLAPRYDGDITLGQSIARIIACRRLVVRVHALAAVADCDRRNAARNSRAAIVSDLGLPPTSTAPGKPVGLPAARPTDDHPTGSLNPEPSGSATA
jgi:1-acyl-sn-glycerol-3-phosphate acyltransferase